ncbi:MAG TPA: hypothetical protein VM470_09510 [Acidimicrobiia bacterium]|nr:hypothetical protein [Acidimicrobiia bacterium]
MSTSVRRGWTRGPYGYREAQLESADFTAAMTLFVAGIPSLMIGAELTGIGIGLGQLVLAVPIGALVGAYVVGLIGKKAAAHGSPSIYLARPAFGAIPAALLTVIRLVLTVTWGAIILGVAGSWIQASFAYLGFQLPSSLGPVLAAVVGIVALLAGPVGMVGLLRRWLFWIAVVLTLVAAWLLVNRSSPGIGQVSAGGFFDSVDAVFGLALLWMAVGGDLAGLGQREDDTANGLALGFGVAALLFVLGGAVLADHLGGFPTDLAVMGTGFALGVLAFVWVPLMESDGFGGLAASGGFALESIVPAVPSLILASVAGAASLLGAILFPIADLRIWADVAVTLFAPGVGVILADAYVVRRGSYLTDDLFSWRGEYGLFNVAGSTSWLLAAVLAIFLRPIGPPGFTDSLTRLVGGSRPGVPTLLISLLVGGILYLGLGWLVLRRRVAPYRLRGV